MAEAGTPVVFVHGLWLHASSWERVGGSVQGERLRGVRAGWPGDADTVEETRANPDRVAGYGIDAVVDHYAQAIGALEPKPIAIGHSFGGLIVQRLLGQDLAAAAVAIDPAPIKGVLALPPSALKVASIALRSPSNKKKAVSLTREQFRYGFGNALPEQESNELFERWTIPSPGLPLFEGAFAAFSPHSPAKVDTRNSTSGPLLVTAGGKDHTVPPAISRSTVKLYRHSWRSRITASSRTGATRSRSTAAGATSPTPSSPG